MLKPLVRERRLEVWSDDRMVTGYEWRPQLAAAIGRSRAALLLVSPAFLASDFIMDQELPALVQHGVRLVPVLVRPCLWQAMPAAGEVQWAHDPGRGTGRWRARRTGGADRRGVPGAERAAGRRRRGAAAAGPRWRRSRRARPVPVAAGPRLGALHEVPPLPRAAVARAELAGLRAGGAGGRRARSG